MTSAFESSFTLRAKAEGFNALEQQIKRIAKAMIQAQQASMKGGDTGTGFAQNPKLLKQQMQQMFEGAYSDPKLGGYQDKSGKWRDARGRYMQAPSKAQQAMMQAGTGLEGVGFSDLQRTQTLAQDDLETGDAGGLLARELTQQLTAQKKEETEATKRSVAVDKQQEKVRNSLNTTISRRLESGKQMLVMDKALGDQSRISAADVAKLRFSIQRLKETQDFQKYATTSQIQSLKALEVQLKTLQAQQYNNASSFQFMAGVGQKAKTAVKQVGAASQGSMLAMSALNGDVMGLAFSLIFLQFAANLPVALGFGAMAIAGVLAFKGIKKIIDTRAEIRKFTHDFAVATGNVQSYSLAQARAGDVVDKFGIKGEAAAQAKQAVIQGILALQQRDIAVTEEALGVMVKSWVIASTKSEDAEEQIRMTTDAVVGWAEGNGALGVTIEGLTYTTDGLNEAVARILAQTDGVVKYGETFGDTLKRLGIDEQDWTDFMIRNSGFRMDELDREGLVISRTARSIKDVLEGLTDADSENFNAKVIYVQGIIDEYDRQAEGARTATESILGESQAFITAMQNEATEKKESVDKIIEEQRRLKRFMDESTVEYQNRTQPRPHDPEYGSQRDGTAKNLTWERYAEIKKEQEDRNRLVDLQQDMEATLYTQSEYMKHMDRSYSGENIEIEIIDQTSGGLLIDKITSKAIYGNYPATSSDTGG